MSSAIIVCPSCGFAESAEMTEQIKSFEKVPGEKGRYYLPDDCVFCLNDFVTEIKNTTATDTGRALRLAVVQNVYDDGHITEAQAREILSGPLTPDKPETVVDDSDQLKVREDDER